MCLFVSSPELNTVSITFDGICGLLIHTAAMIWKNSLLVVPDWVKKDLPWKYACPFAFGWAKTIFYQISFCLCVYT